MGSHHVLRQLNETRALAALFRGGGTSRADLSRQLKLTRSTTGSLVQSLIQSGLAQEGVEGVDVETRVGRPGIVVEINGDGAFFVGASIGVDRIAAVAIDLAAEVRFEETRDFDGRGCDPRDAARRLGRLVRTVVERLPAGTSVDAVSVAIPGFLAADQHSYHAALLGWHDVDVASILEHALRTRVMVENDANAFAVAETYRSRDEPSDCLVVLIENGVGGGIINGERVYRGRLRGAGEIGHMRIGEEGFAFDAERPGRFETFVGKGAVVARYRHCGGKGGFEELVAEAHRGAPVALRVVREWGHWLARGLAVLVNVLEPQRIVLGGSVSALYPLVETEVGAELASAIAEGFPTPRIELSSIGGNGAALGAACLLHQAMLSLDTPFTRPA